MAYRPFSVGFILIAAFTKPPLPSVYDGKIEAVITGYLPSYPIQWPGEPTEQRKWCELITQDGQEITIPIPARIIPAIGDTVEMGRYLDMDEKNNKYSYRFRKILKRKPRD